MSLSLQPLLQRLPPALEKSAASLRLAITERSATASLAAIAALCTGDGGCTMAIWGLAGPDGPGRDKTWFWVKASVILMSITEMG